MVVGKIKRRKTKRNYSAKHKINKVPKPYQENEATQTHVINKSV